MRTTGLDVEPLCWCGGAAVPDGEGAGWRPGEQHHGGPGHRHLQGLGPAGPVPQAVPPQPRQEQGQATAVRRALYTVNMWGTRSLIPHFLHGEHSIVHYCYSV